MKIKETAKKHNIATGTAIIVWSISIGMVGLNQLFNDRLYLCVIFFFSCLIEEAIYIANVSKGI